MAAMGSTQCETGCLTVEKSHFTCGEGTRWPPASAKMAAEARGGQHIEIRWLPASAKMAAKGWGSTHSDKMAATLSQDGRQGGQYVEIRWLPPLGKMAARGSNALGQDGCHP